MSFIADADFPIPGETAVCTDYDFDTTNGTVRVFENDFICYLLIINITRGQVIFNPGKPALAGKQRKNFLQLTLPTDTMANDDALLIICAVNRQEHIRELLSNINKQLKLNNELLQGILEA